MTSSTDTRRKTADIIFGALRDQIMSLELLPGTKMSEAEIALKFGVSRQPVREAFNLLGNLDLLDIQPQKATRVQRFSLRRIAAARFERLAIELEVARSACRNWSSVHAPGLEACLSAQHTAVETTDAKLFHTLDAKFHRLIFDVAAPPLPFARVLEKKAQVDRICVLSLKDAEEMATLVADHALILDGLTRRDEAGLDAAIRLHLSRIDRTIAAVRAAHPDYFDD
ncbi:GntR family transcriptional regulator [Jannaschia marina]|uniref:GntR family transcriptional regulator n=1 Tax=Jannaschia marina TaxID=2741674 RepID=UPI0015CB13A2|nr:GntR family transcriptional regulator [Jannaschia marina]